MRDVVSKLGECFVVKVKEREYWEGEIIVVRKWGKLNVDRR